MKGKPVQTLLVVWVMVSLAVLSLIGVAPRAAAANETNLWASAEIEQHGVEDLYRWGKVQTCFSPGGSCIYEDGYGGQVYWQWMVNRIEDINPQLDFYAVYLQFMVNPSYNKGNPDPTNIEYATYKSAGANVLMDLLPTNQQIGAYLPDSSIGTGTATYGISASVSDSGGNPGAGVTFTASQSYTISQVDVSASTDRNPGGYQSWGLSFTGDAPKKQYTFFLTALVGTGEGVDLELDITPSWSLNLIASGIGYVAADSFTWTRTLRVYWPKDPVNLKTAATAGCQAVTLNWDAYTGRYFDAYPVYVRPPNGIWMLWTIWTPQSLSTNTVKSLGPDTVYEFQMLYRVHITSGTDYFYSRLTNILSAKSGATCPPPPPPPPPPPGCIAKGTWVTLADQSTKKVEQVQVGDQILGYDVATQTFVAEVVLRVTRTKVQSLVIINDGELRVTPTNQPIYIRAPDFQGWINDPKEIKVGWKLFRPLSGTWINVQSVELSSQPVWVYDFVTDGPQAFLANSILVLDKRG